MDDIDNKQCQPDTCAGQCQGMTDREECQWGEKPHPPEQTPCAPLNFFVSVLRGKIFCLFYHFITFVLIWSMCVALMEAASIIEHPGWWMVYGFATGQWAWWAADKVKGFSKAPTH